MAKLRSDLQSFQRVLFFLFVLVAQRYALIVIHRAEGPGWISR